MKIIPVLYNLKSLYYNQCILALHDSKNYGLIKSSLLVIFQSPLFDLVVSLEAFAESCALFYARTHSSFHGISSGINNDHSRLRAIDFDPHFCAT